MKIPYLTQTGCSQFYPLVREVLRESGERWPLVVQFPKTGGYGGAVKVTIDSATEAEFEADLESTDWAQFPARICATATATALRDSGWLASYQVNHNDGTLEVRPS